METWTLQSTMTPNHYGEVSNDVSPIDLGQIRSLGHPNSGSTGRPSRATRRPPPLTVRRQAFTPFSPGLRHVLLVVLGVARAFAFGAILVHILLVVPAPE